MKTPLVFILLLLSCSGDKGAEPVDIHYGQDICERCKMIISEEKFSAQLILNNGNIYKFDDIGGMIHYINEKNLSPEISKIYVKDYNTGKWLSSEEALFIFTNKIKTPMNYGIIALSVKQSADNNFSEHGGSKVGNFQDTTEFLTNKELNH